MQAGTQFWKTGRNGSRYLCCIRLSANCEKLEWKNKLGTSRSLSLRHIKSVELIKHNKKAFPPSDRKPPTKSFFSDFYPFGVSSALADDASTTHESSMCPITLNMNCVNTKKRQKLAITTTSFDDYKLWVGGLEYMLLKTYRCVRKDKDEGSSGEDMSPKQPTLEQRRKLEKAKRKEEKKRLAREQKEAERKKREEKKKAEKEEKERIKAMARQIRSERKASLSSKLFGTRRQTKPVPHRPRSKSQPLITMDSRLIGRVQQGSSSVRQSRDDTYTGTRSPAREKVVDSEPGRSEPRNQADKAALPAAKAKEASVSSESGESISSSDSSASNLESSLSRLLDEEDSHEGSTSTSSSNDGSSAHCESCESSLSMSSTFEDEDGSSSRDCSIERAAPEDEEESSCSEEQRKQILSDQEYDGGMPTDDTTQRDSEPLCITTQEVSVDPSQEEGQLAAEHCHLLWK